MFVGCHVCFPADRGIHLKHDYTEMPSKCFCIGSIYVVNKAAMPINVHCGVFYT